MKKVCFVFNSRNNYTLFNDMFFKWSKCNFDNVLMLNVDIESTEEQKRIGKQICKNYGIVDINMDDDPLRVSVPRTLEKAFDYIEENNLDIDFVMWWSHDNFIPQNDFFERFLDFVYNNKEDINNKVGVIGFGVRDIVELNKFCYGRGSLVKGTTGWLQNLSNDYLDREYFIVESSCFTSVAINRKLYRKYIKSDYNFKLYVWGDDVSHQFARNNVASITIPNLYFIDGWRTKPAFGTCRAYDSFLNKNNYFHLDNTNDHIELFFQKWKFHLSEPRCRDEFSKNIELYRGTLQEKLYNWDILEGPKILKDI